jgi:hypothetical protein
MALWKTVVGCDFWKSSFGKAVVGWIEVCLVGLMWLLKKSPYFQVGPTCHAHMGSSSSSGHYDAARGGLLRPAELARGCGQARLRAAVGGARRLGDAVAGAHRSRGRACTRRRFGRTATPFGVVWGWSSARLCRGRA